MIGNRYGRLTILSQEPSRKKHTYWLCKCDCGNTKVLAGRHLRSGDTVSCGCAFNDAMAVSGKKHVTDDTNLSILNDKLFKNNTSGVRGVCLQKNGKWVASIDFKKKRYYLGTYDKKEDAIAARKEAEEKYFKPILDKYKKDRL